MLLRMSTARVRFPVSGPFHADLKRRVEAYFSGRTPHGGWRMRVKTAVLLAWLGGTWALAMFVPVSGAQAALLAISMGLAMAGVGFSVMHDANHGSYSKDPRINRVLSFTLDLLGASSHLWRQKHNILHHTYTNIAGLDDDIESGTPHLRFAPWQRHRFFHRFQHLYVWLLYGLFPLKWFFIDDFRQFVTGRIGTQRFPAARGGASGKGRVLRLGVRAAGAAAPDLVADPALAPGFVHPGQRARLGVPARPLPARRGFRRGAPGAGHGSRVGAAPGDHHGRLRQAEPVSFLVPGRAQLPGRAPPVPARLPRALSGAVPDRRADLRRPRRRLPRGADAARRPGGERALAADPGPPDACVMTCAQAQPLSRL